MASCDVLTNPQMLAETFGWDFSQVHCPPHIRAVCETEDCLLAAVLNPSEEPRNADLYSPQLGLDAFMLRLERTAHLNGWSFNLRQ